MVEIPIVNVEMIRTPSTPNSDVDGYRWRVQIDPLGPLYFDLSESDATAMGMRSMDLTSRIPEAVQRFGARKGLRNDEDVIAQIAAWDFPLLLMADDFR